MRQALQRHGAAAAPAPPPAPAKPPLVPSDATLVVCPVSAVLQWRSEVERFVRPGVLPNVVVYHGPKRTSDVAALARADVVLTSYATLEVDWRKACGGAGRVRCGHCGKAYTEDALVTHLTYFCGKGAARTAAQAKQVRKRDRGDGGGRRGLARSRQRRFGCTAAGAGRRVTYDSWEFVSISG